MIEKTRKIVTYDDTGKENGFVLRLFENGTQSIVYMIGIAVKGFKGYHMHKKRTEQYVCIKGEVEVKFHEYNNGKCKETIHILTPQSRLLINPGTVVSIQNVSNEEAWIVNYPNPPYDSEETGEQLKFSRTEYEKEGAK